MFELRLLCELCHRPYDVTLTFGNGTDTVLYLLPCVNGCTRQDALETPFGREWTERQRGEGR